MDKGAIWGGHGSKRKSGEDPPAAPQPFRHFHCSSHFHLIFLLVISPPLPSFVNIDSEQGQSKSSFRVSCLEPRYCIPEQVRGRDREGTANGSRRGWGMAWV